MRALPSGPFQVIVMDPPWSYGAVNHRSSAEKHYPTIKTASEIVAVAPVREVADPNGAALYLWVTNPKLRLGLDVMEALGFTYKTCVTWVKVTKAGTPHPGMGFFFRGVTEHVLLGTIGGYAIPPSLRVPNVIHARRREHSAKPDEFYRVIEAASPGQRRLDVFARTERRDWSTWGNELEEAA